MAKKYLDENGVIYLFNKITSKIPIKTSSLANDSGFVTETELTAKGYLTEHQSLANYYTKTQVDSAITTAINNITNGDEVSY